MPNLYAVSAELVAHSPGLESHGGLALYQGLEAASRWIDGYCLRKFWLDPEPTIRYFKVCNRYVIGLGPHEIGDATDVTVDVDDGTGTFATPVAPADFQLEPVNALFDTRGPAPFTSIRKLADSWPSTYVYPPGRQERVRITARYGWPTVPPGIREACIGLTVDGFENPSGVRSQSIDGYSVSYSVSVISWARSLLSQFRKPLVG